MGGARLHPVTMLVGTMPSERVLMYVGTVLDLHSIITHAYLSPLCGRGENCWFRGKCYVLRMCSFAYLRSVVKTVSLL